jgi:coenzyme F420-0:L-glutamate ligase/coenzyme F420-1:gamma-L-glutamate ligase
MSLAPEALLDWIESRRSIRRFDDRPVPRETLERILQTACSAPSAHNSQPWRFAVVLGGEARRSLADRMAEEFRADLRADGLNESEVESRLERAIDRLMRAPAAVVLCSTLSGGRRFADARRQQAEETMALQSASLAGGQLLLAAHAEGLGACWMCGPLFAPQAVRDALDLPADWEPQAVIALGWPAEKPTLPDRRPSDDTVVWR